MHSAFPAEGLAAAVLTDMSPSWFLTQAMSNYSLNNKQPSTQTASPCRGVSRLGSKGVCGHSSEWFSHKKQKKHPASFSSFVIPSFSAPRSAQLLSPSRSQGES